ncbi:MAG: phage/plasmid primase, P4 family [Polyangia bacterium]
MTDGFDTSNTGGTHATVASVKDAFRRAMIRRNLIPSASLIADGQIHRCGTEGKPDKQDGSYVLHLDGLPAGGFQNHRDGKGWEYWCSRNLKELSSEEHTKYLARADAMKKMHAAEQEQIHAEKSKLATSIFSGAPSVVFHAYLTRKGVKSHGLRQNYDSKLIVPAYSGDGEISTLQFIDINGEKRFLAGGKKAGCWFPIGKLTDEVICICEGYATGASIHEATGHYVIVAFDGGNLLSVAEAHRTRHPKAKIIICSDDDHRTDGNPGLAAATHAAQVVRGMLALPDFGDGRREDDTDFNDLHASRGVDAVKACIERAATPEGNPPWRKVPLTDSGNAERLVEMFGDDVRFVPEWGKFHVWNGKFWAEDAGSVRVLERSKAVARSFLVEASTCDSEERRDDLAKHALRSEQEPKRRAMVALVKAEPLIRLEREDLDRDRMLLNVLNGTLDLRTGRLKLHDRSDYITHILPVAYDPEARCPRWETFLTEVLPDEETIAFIQRAIGYSLTGDVSEHCLFFLHGSGANGKSAFLLVILALLGEYATQAPTSMLLAKEFEAHPTELTTLFGRRVAVCQETPAGKRWAEEVIKHITGGDRISARRMREDFWEFDPTHKLWVSGNHKPIVQGIDEGIWRRLHLVPFERPIPEEQQDHKLVDKLRAELPGILAWAVLGCLAWQHVGLSVSAKVRDATATYREESDRLGPFLQECCRMEPGTVVTRKSIYQAYTGWSHVQGERWPMSDRDFADALRGHGVDECWTHNTHGKKCRGWRGISMTGNTSNRYPPDFPYDPDLAHAGDVNRQTGGNVLPPVADPGEDVV